MPHLTLEFTNNLSGFDAQKALLHMNKAIFQSGHFDEADIKSRAIPIDCFVIGTSPENRAFVHAKLAVLSNRPPAVRQALSTMLLKELSDLLPEYPGASCSDLRRDIGDRTGYLFQDCPGSLVEQAPGSGTML